MTRPARFALILAGIAGAIFSSLKFLEIIRVIRTNGLTDGEPVDLREHYLQVGTFYSRGFTTGFFFCFSLMLVAIAIGTWYDERRKERRIRMSAPPILAPAPPPAGRG